MSWIKNNDSDYSKTIGEHGTLSCTKHCSLGDIWWEIDYEDEYVDKYVETDEDEIDPEKVDRVLEYADKWLFELIENIKAKYNKLEVNR